MPWYWDQPKKTLKRETVLNLNLVKNYQVSKRKGFFKKCTTLIMVIRFAPNKNNNQRSKKNKRFDEALTAIRQDFSSIRKFQQFARFNSTPML